MTDSSSREEYDALTQIQISAIRDILSSTIEVSSVKFGDEEGMAQSLRKLSAGFKELEELFPEESKRAKDTLASEDENVVFDDTADENASNATFRLSSDEICIAFLYAYDLESYDTVSALCYVMQQIFVALMEATGNSITQSFYERPLSDVFFEMKIND